MNKQEKIDIISTFVENYQNISKQIDVLDKFFNVNVDGEFINAIYRSLEDYTSCVEKLTGYDENEWVSWYIFDNDCGKKGLLANDKRITSVEDLVNILEEE